VGAQQLQKQSLRARKSGGQLCGHAAVPVHHIIMQGFCGQPAGVDSVATKGIEACQQDGWQ
jgi:hypothetical protein